MKGCKILIVDDDRFFCDIKTVLLQKNNFTVDSLNNPDDVIERLKGVQYNLVLLDLKIGNTYGIDVLERIKESYPDIIVIMITAYSDVSVAVEAVKKGAYDYLSKDISDSELLIKINRAIDKHNDITEIHSLKHALTEQFSFANVVGKNKKMQKIYSTVKNICDTNASVLITGETGTGKELIAKSIHFNSRRSKCPFIAVNCAAISEHLTESELFGHEKGAFTDAYRQRIGKAEAADGGTLFLDEIGDMPLRLQGKLLRFLQEKQFERVGGNAEITSDVRIISATNKELAESIEKNTFRRDLYYRINVVHIVVPPLRERIDDLPALTEYFIKQSCIRFGKKPKGIEDRALEILKGYKWPGNIRELENIIDSLTLSSEFDTISASEVEGVLPLSAEKSAREKKAVYADMPLRQAREKFEKDYLVELLGVCMGNITAVSSRSGMNRKSIFLKLQQYGLKKEDFK